MELGAWIFAGKAAIALLPLMLVLVGATLVVAIMRDRADRAAEETGASKGPVTDTEHDRSGKGSGKGRGKRR
ncbi:MAG: hypothetical protein JXQ73_23920 [Phycisphaerae bacterium]|nr:hypothetical protein [Phycisphaerae bacterium]